MAEINKENGLLALVDNDTYDFGEVSQDAVIEYSFPFKGSDAQIEYIEKGCGCTSAYFENGAIAGSLDLPKANGNREYEPGETAVQKSIVVWLNDGQPRFIPNHRKERMMNNNKSFFRLNIAGKVVV